MKMANSIKSIGAAELLLLVPLLAMLFTDQIQWDVRDFAVMSVLLAGVGMASYLVVSGIKQNSRQTWIGLLLIAIVLTLYVELAVGIFGSPIAGS